MKGSYSLLFFLSACGVQLEDGKNNEDTSVTADTADSADTNENLSDCPDSVPEQYRYVWDCQSSNCGGAMVYRYGVGSTNEMGKLSMSEQWFIFEGGTTMIDVFDVEGNLSDVNESTFGLANMEENYEIHWTLSDHQSGWNWTKTFAEQENDEQRYYGFLMIDTHTTLTQERNPDNAILVSAAPVKVTPDGSYYDLINDYARGTATPSVEETDGEYVWVPSGFEWASSGSCYQ